MQTLSDEFKSLGQVVLVMQGGGALGAYQVGVFQALHEAGIEPDWVIGTSIGAINAALIAGNRPENRMEALTAFWARVGQGDMFGLPQSWFSPALRNMMTVNMGLPGFFRPNLQALMNPQAQLGADHASFYTVDPLRETLSDLIDFDALAAGKTRLTVGASHVRSSEMRYFDSRDMALKLDHVIASGALPPAFPAVRIDGELYWDGGILSNTPIEVVFDDKPRRSSLIFSVNIWNPDGQEPETITQVMARMKDVQYSSRGITQIKRQRQLHRLRHVVAELAKLLPEDVRKQNSVAELAGYGCLTKMHVIRLLAPALPKEDHMKDIDFSAEGIRQRRDAGYRDTRETLEKAPWREPHDPLEGFILHEARNGEIIETAAAK